MDSQSYTTYMQHLQTQISYLRAFLVLKTLVLVLKEIIFQQFSASYDVSEKCITPQDFLSWGVFCKNCGTINKKDFTYKILLSSDYQQVNKCRKFLYFMEFELKCIMMIIIRRIFMQSIIEIRQLLKLIQLDASRELCHQDS